MLMYILFILISELLSKISIYSILKFLEFEFESQPTFGEHKIFASVV